MGDQFLNTSFQSEGLKGHMSFQERKIISSTVTRSYSRFSHNVTEIQVKKLSIPLGFCFHEVLQHLNTYI